MFFVSTPLSITEVYHWTISSSFCKCLFVSSSYSFLFLSFGFSLLARSHSSSLSLYYTLKSLMLNTSSLWILNLRSSLILGIKRSYRLRAVLSSIAYSASMTGLLRAKAASSCPARFSSSSTAASLLSVLSLKSTNWDTIVWCDLVSAFRHV